VVIDISVKTRLVHRGRRDKRRWRREHNRVTHPGGTPTSTPARTVEGRHPRQFSDRRKHLTAALHIRQRSGAGQAVFMTATLPLGANLKDPVVLPLVDRRQALELDEKRRCVVDMLAFTLKTRLMGFVLRLRTRLSDSAFELMFTIAEPYDASDAFLYHNPQHHRVPICHHRLCPVPSPANTPQRTLRPPLLTTAHQHQHFSTTPLTEHHTSCTKDSKTSLNVPTQI
jgi:hypothetical protein